MFCSLQDPSQFLIGLLVSGSVDATDRPCLPLLAVIYYPVRRYEDGRVDITCCAAAWARLRPTFDVL